MFRTLALALLLLVGIAASAATTITAVINGKTVTVPVVLVNGKYFLDVAALAKLTGGSFNAAAKKLVIGAAGQAAPSAGAAGTAQLPGENGKPGTIYKMYKNKPMYFCLKSVEFTTQQVVIGDALYAPKANEKLMVLRFTVQNPNKENLFIRGDYLTFMAVDAMNVNHMGVARWGDAESRGYVALELKPAQKIELYSVITVPAKGVIPKLMVQAAFEQNLPVLRYDLRDIVKPLPAPFADPADASGATALTEVPAQLGTLYPYNDYSMTVEKFEYVTTPLDGVTPAAGGRTLVATLLIKNQHPTSTFVRHDHITPELITTDGEKLRYYNMLFATADRRVAMELDPGKDLRVRIYFGVPKDCTPETLKLKEDQSRTYLYQVQ